MLSKDQTELISKGYRYSSESKDAAHLMEHFSRHV